MRESLGCEWRSATKLKKVITHSCGSSHSFLFAQVTFPLSDWVKGDDRSLDRVRCSDCNRIYRVPTAFDLSTTMMTERFGGAHGRGVGNAPVVCEALLGLIVVYALSRAPRRPQ